MQDIEIKSSEKQRQMHKDFFDRCKYAIEAGYYLEAILMEYAAIESRLEAICGIVGFPCGQYCLCRKDIAISTRINCLRVYRNTFKSVFKKTKLSPHFFTEKGTLRKWIDERNRIVHGLFKNEVKYTQRIQNSKDLAEKGYEYARLLYNEANRIRRLTKNHPEIFVSVIPQCKNNDCKGFNKDNQ